MRGVTMLTAGAALLVGQGNPAAGQAPLPVPPPPPILRAPAPAPPAPPPLPAAIARAKLPNHPQIREVGLIPLAGAEGRALLATGHGREYIGMQ